MNAQKGSRSGCRIHSLMQVPCFRCRRLTVFLLIALSLPLYSADHGKNPYQQWLEEDVAWIIEPAERAEYLNLSSDQQRDRFIVEFWKRRDPTPETDVNEYKEEHYRRIAYSNVHFASSLPGWKTDRGRLYIMYGPPDRVDAHADVIPPYEVWTYRYIESLGQHVSLKFIDKCRCNEYRLKLGPHEKSPFQ